MNQNKISLLGGIISSLLYYIVSYLLDTFQIKNINSNLIGLVIESLVDFFVQVNIFLSLAKITPMIIFKFLIVRTVYIIINQSLFSLQLNCLQKYKKSSYYEYMLLVCRFINNLLLFTFIFYRLRKEFIYK